MAVGKKEDFFNLERRAVMHPITAVLVRKSDIDLFGLWAQCKGFPCLPGALL